MKKWIDLRAQVDKHIERGLDLGAVSFEEFALFLYSNNYYRVSGYGRCFYIADEDRYEVGTQACHLMAACNLDREVRACVLEGVGVFEPTIRSRVAYQFSRNIDGSDAYLDPGLYLPEGSEPSLEDRKAHDNWVKRRDNRDHVLKSFQEIQQRRELFIQHHLAKGDPIPFWAAVEVMSLGTFSRFLRALRDKSPLLPVADSLGLEDDLKLMQAVQNITFLRNIAAHHGRLWNRRFDGHVTLPAVALEVKRQYVHEKTPAAALTLLAGLVDRIQGSNAYSTKLLDLVHDTPELAVGYYKPIL